MMVREFENSKQNNPQKGTILIVTLFFIVLLTLEVSMVSFVMQRSVGEKAIITTSYNAAKDATRVATQRLRDDLYAYIQANGTTNVATDFAKGGANDIDNVDLMAYDAEDSADEDTGVDISAWVEEVRGHWYHIMVRAKFGETDLLAHDWVKYNEQCMSTSTVSALTTILTGEDNPGRILNTNADSNGRVFFGEDDSPGSFWTWHKSTGLSTIFNDGAYPGKDDPAYSWLPSSVIAPDGRIYFGEDSSVAPVWTWKEDTGLSTIITDGYYTSGEHNLAVNSSGRLAFAGAYPNESTNKKVWTYHPSTGLTTIATNLKAPGSGTMAIADNNRIYFGEYSNSGNFYSWEYSTGLSTLVTSEREPGRFSVAVHSDSRVFFSNTESNGEVWTWLPATGLSTICENCGARPGRERWFLDNSGRYTFGNNSSPGTLRSYHVATGLSTVIDIGAGQSAPFTHNGGGDVATGRIFFGGFGGGENFYTWHGDTGLSTLLTNQTRPGYYSVAVDSASGRAFFGEDDTPGTFWTWKLGTGLSTIVDGIEYPGFESVVAGDDERVFFGEWSYGNPDSFFSWSPSTGLSTVISNNEARPGAFSIIYADNTVFFGEQADPGNFWAWHAGSSSAGCPY